MLNLKGSFGVFDYFRDKVLSESQCKFPAFFRRETFVYFQIDWTVNDHKIRILRFPDFDLLVTSERAHTLLSGRITNLGQGYEA
jgi:hypothetical protein